MRKICLLAVLAGLVACLLACCSSFVSVSIHMECIELACTDSLIDDESEHGDAILLGAPWTSIGSA